MTFHGLAKYIVKQVDKPLTANKIWQLAVGSPRWFGFVIRTF